MENVCLSAKDDDQQLPAPTASSSLQEAFLSFKKQRKQRQVRLYAT